VELFYVDIMELFYFDIMQSFFYIDIIELIDIDIIVVLHRYRVVVLRIMEWYLLILCSRRCCLQLYHGVVLRWFMEWFWLWYHRVVLHRFAELFYKVITELFYIKIIELFYINFTWSCFTFPEANSPRIWRRL